MNTDLRWAVENTEQIATILPRFDRYHLGRVLRMTFDFEGEDGLSVTLLVEYTPKEHPPVLVEVAFIGVASARVPDVGWGVFELKEFEVLDISDRGMEQINIEAKDHQNELIIMCRRAILTKLTAWEGGTPRVLWHIGCPGPEARPSH